MEGVFLRLLSISITTGWFLLAAIFVRFLFKKLPKGFFCFLWLIAFLRLLFPFSLSLESIFSLAPSLGLTNKIENYRQEAFGVSPVMTQDNSIQHLPPVPSDANTLPTDISSLPSLPQDMANTNIFITVVSFIWLFGIFLMLVYGIYSCLRLSFLVKEAVRLRDNIWQCDRIKTPFLLGFIRPRIYIPFHMPEKELFYVLAHENAHIARRDYLSKPFAYLVLSLYWFHPLIWLSYLLFCRDIELACDERVIRKLGSTEKKPYSEALLACSTDKKIFSACPLAFGTTGIKNRIKNVLHYKKPAFWVSVSAVLGSILLCICFLTSPEKESETNLSKEPAATADISQTDSPEPAFTKSPDLNTEENTPQQQSPASVYLIPGAPVLLVTDSTYRYPNYIDASISSDVYLEADGTREKIGSLNSTGTAYPLRFSLDGLFEAGGHFVARYVVDEENRQLLLVEYANEVFDENGNPSYTYFNLEEGEQTPEDDSYLNAMWVKYENASVIHFLRSKKTTTEPFPDNPQTVSNETALKLPFGEPLLVDLNGDGEKEKLLVTMKPAVTIEDTQVSSPEPEIRINNLIFEADYILNCMGALTTCDLEYFYLFDIDTTDGYREIGFFDEGPSWDPETKLLRYDEDTLAYIGSFCDYSGQCMDTLSGIPGDGSVSVLTRYDVIQTDCANGLWKLEHADSLYARLKEQGQEVYEFFKMEQDFPPLAKTDLLVYSRMDNASDTIVIPSGSQIRFARYYPDGKWLEIEFDEGRKSGWIIQESFSTSILPDGSYDSRDLFDYLNYSD